MTPDDAPPEPEEEIKNPPPVVEAEPQPALSWEEQKRRAQDPFNCELMQEFERQIEEGGEIREYGLGQNWFDRTTALFRQLYCGEK